MTTMRTTNNKGTREVDICAIGYSSKLFPWSELDNRTEDSYLIQWQDDDELLIDRYDCRLYLSDLSSKVLGTAEVKGDEEQFTDAIEEELCETERWLDLKEALAQATTSENNEVRGKGAEICFTYNESNSNEENGDDDGLSDDSDEESEEPYEPPTEVKIPVGTNLPQTSKLGHIIERTARFVALHGNQMEIIIKAKHRKHRDRFNFLEFEHPLYPFYKFLCKAIREKKWMPPAPKPKIMPNEHVVAPRPPKTSKSDEESESSDDDNDGYLHPLLLASAKKSSNTLRASSQPPVPPASKSNPYSSLYEALHPVSSPKPSISQVTFPERPIVSSITQIETDPVEAQNYELWHQFFYQRPSPFAPNSPPLIIYPPDNMTVQINVAAKYVAANGRAFAERRLIEHNNGRLDFLYPNSPLLVFYHNRIRFYQLELSSTLPPFVHSKYHVSDLQILSETRTHPTESTQINYGNDSIAKPPPESRDLVKQTILTKAPTPPSPPIDTIQTQQFPEHSSHEEETQDEEIKRLRKERARQFMADLIRRKATNNEVANDNKMEATSSSSSSSSNINNIQNIPSVVPADKVVPSLISKLVTGQLQQLAGTGNFVTSLNGGTQHVDEDKSLKDRSSLSHHRERSTSQHSKTHSKSHRQSSSRDQKSRKRKRSYSRSRSRTPPRHHRYSNRRSRRSRSRS